ncbi:MAG TPA: cyclase [Thermoleophilia bacterium]|nr:cyclase [Thermoleophilia bacterium]
MYVIVQHTVRDYDAWKPVFDEHGSVRRRHGATGHVIYRSLDDPNSLTIVNEFPSREQAEAFTRDPSLREAMERGGVVSEPVITWAEEVDTVDYQAQAA